MLPVIEVVDWLDTLALDSSVGVEDGGLTLREIDKTGRPTAAYLELGGVPEDTK